MRSRHSPSALRWLTLLASLFPSRLRGQAASPPLPDTAFSRVEAVPFAQGKFGPLLADLDLPKGAGNLPAIVFVHGGDWISGDRTQMAKLARYFAEHGYVTVAIDYDLSPGVHFPVALYECKEAIRWLRAHAAEYHVDPQRIAVAGSSAGGELAALVALTNGQPRFEGDGGSKNFSSSVKTAVIYNAALDLTALPDDYPPTVQYLGGPCSEKRELCLEASPRFRIGTTLPPLFIGQGTADAHIPYAQLTSFVTRYRNSKGTVTVFSAEGGPHTYWATPAWFQANAEATLQFLKLYL